MSPARCVCGHLFTEHAARRVDSAAPCLVTWLVLGGHAACKCREYRRAASS